LRKRVNFILRLSVSLGILFVLFKIVPYNELIFHLKRADLPLLSICFLIFVAVHLLGVLRWQIALRALDLKVKYKELFFLFFCGLFFNLIFPSVIAQDAFRAGILGLKEGKPYKKIVASLVIERFLGFFALCFIAIASFALGRSLIAERSVFTAVFLLFLAVLFLGLFIFSRRFFKASMFFFGKFASFKDKAVEFHRHLYIFRSKPLVLLKVFSISIIIQISFPVIFYLFALSFGVRVNPLFFFILVPIIMCVAVLPVTIAGLGTREAMAVYFFSKIGIEKSVALGISLMHFLFYISIGLLGGLLYVAFYSRRIQSDKKDI